MRFKAIQALLLPGIIGLVGCSGPQKDVRVSFCKDMVAAHLGALDTIWWVSDSSEIRRPEYARIDLQFKIGDADAGAAPQRASCSYGYDVPEENAITHTEPLVAYATVPYRMVVNGEAMAEPALKQLITDVGLLQAGEFLDRFWKWLGKVAPEIKESLM